ncbi:TetR family transcriptional regulator [Nocardia sp. ET3-3]|uniref:TetR family transcriptional regulator n=1 Tax=Nocardia terrae TaxID=2675851 RepID=A0A7K1UYI1_9NOCA|nr:TetR family transcriptional regulator [Nocardia terrae]
MTTPTTDRRSLIVDSAIDLIAAQGLRALTHRALDTALDLPAGSTSYYFRTRRALLEGIVERIATRSRTDFADRQPEMDETREDLDVDRLARGTATWLDRLLAQRRNHLITRHALIVELLGDAELHEKLVGCLFSHRHATALFETLGATDPATAAADFIAVIEGLIFDRFAGARTGLQAGTAESVRQLTAVLAVQLRAAS